MTAGSPFSREYRDITVDELREAIERGESNFDGIRLEEGADLSWINLAALETNLSFRDSFLQKTLWNKAVLYFSNYQGQEYSVDFSGSRMLKADFSDAKLSLCNFKKADLEKAIFRNTDLFCVGFERAVLPSAKFSGDIDFSMTNFSNSYLWNAEFEGASFYCTIFRKACLADARFHDSVFDFVDLRNADLQYVELENVEFNNSHQENSDVSYAKGFDSAKFSDSFVNGTIINGVDVEVARIWHYRKGINRITWPLFWFVFAFVPFVFAYLSYQLNLSKKEEAKEIMREEGPLTTLETPEPRFPSIRKVQDWTTVNGLDLTVTSDSLFKREFLDMQFIQIFEKRHPFIAKIWWWSSECGRNLTLWMLWTLLIPIIFGFFYSKPQCPKMFNSFAPILYKMSPDFYVAGGETLDELHKGGDNQIVSMDGRMVPARVPTKVTPYYFSIVTFTTLGFGDIQPINKAGEIWLTIEVFLGYVMLGGMVAILANKLVRRF